MAAAAPPGEAAEIATLALDGFGDGERVAGAVADFGDADDGFEGVVVGDEVVRARSGGAGDVCQDDLDERCAPEHIGSARAGGAGGAEPAASGVAVVGSIVVKGDAANQTGHRALRIAGAGVYLELSSRHRQVNCIAVANGPSVWIHNHALVAVPIAEGLLLDKGKQPYEPASHDAVIIAGRHGTMGAFIIGDAYTDLLDVVDALRAP